MPGLDNPLTVPQKIACAARILDAEGYALDVAGPHTGMHRARPDARVLIHNHPYQGHLLEYLVRQSRSRAGELYRAENCCFCAAAHAILQTAIGTGTTATWHQGSPINEMKEP